MSTRWFELVKSEEENVAHTLYTVEWFAAATPVSHTKMLKKSMRGLCSYKD